MRRLGVLFLSCFWAGLLPHTVFGAAADKPDFREIYSLIESNLPAGMSRAEFNDLALKGLLSALEPRVSLATTGAPPVASTPSTSGKGSRISRTEVFDRTIAYFRIQEIADDLSAALAESFKQLAGTNKIQGVVLDLRYCVGSNYAQAAAVADLFVAGEKPLLDWGEGMVSSRNAGTLINVPAAMIVNKQTTGAAEALAAALRETGAGLVIGSRTAGLAASGREFDLASGQRLRISVRPVRLGNGTAMSSTGLEPDISVDIGSDEERAYFADAFAVLTRTNNVDGGSVLVVEPAGTNRAARKMRFNEADLVREHTEGRTETVPRSDEPERQVVNDPALARALDVLKGLALVRQRR